MPAINTLATLKAGAATALVRADFDDRIATAVPLAEAWLNRNLRLRMMEATAPLTGVVGSRLLALPPSFLEPLSLQLDGGDERRVLPMAAPSRTMTTCAGRPETWAIEGPAIALDRPCDAAYDFTLRYLERFALDDDSDSNDLLMSWPDLYLMALLVTVCGLYLTDDPRLPLWAQARDGLLAEVMRKEARSKAPAQLSTDPVLRGFDRSRGADFQHA